jgi:hypothetical protein
MAPSTQKLKPLFVRSLDYTVIACSEEKVEEREREREGDLLHLPFHHL